MRIALFLFAFPLSCGSPVEPTIPAAPCVVETVQTHPYHKTLPVDNLDELQAAQAMGWRTFRGRTKDLPIIAGEWQCPAAKEIEVKTKQCWSCLQCNGGSGVHISLEEH